MGSAWRSFLTAVSAVRFKRQTRRVSTPSRWCRAPVTLRRVATTAGSRYSLSVLDWRQCDGVERDPTKVSGAWIFKGTRVPVRALFENLEDGASVDQFLEWFPGVARRQIEAVLELAASSLTEA